MFFFFNDTATTEIYTLPLHDALPIFVGLAPEADHDVAAGGPQLGDPAVQLQVRARLLEGVVDRKSTRLNSSHANISYAVFCLKKKKPNLPTCRQHTDAELRSCPRPHA